MIYLLFVLIMNSANAQDYNEELSGMLGESNFVNQEFLYDYEQSEEFQTKELLIEDISFTYNHENSYEIIIEEQELEERNQLSSYHYDNN